MRLDFRTFIVPVKRSAALISDALSDDAAGEERFVAVAAVTLGVLVVAAFALLVGTV